MSMTDPIADMLARLRNGQMARKEIVRMPASKLKRAVLDVLKTEGYITDVVDVSDSKHPELEVTLKYANGKPVMSEISRYSRPGLRQYSPSKEVPLVRNGLGVAIVTTSKGVMTDSQARDMNVGGEVLCKVF